MKRPSEGQLGEALRELDLEAFYVYRLPDPKTGAGVSNWKPCDFMVWWPAAPSWTHGVHAAWVEAKDTTQINVFPYADLRPSQLAGILEARRLGIPYLLAIYWRQARRWTISDAGRVVAWFNPPGEPRPKSIPRELLMSRFGIDAAPRDLSQTIRYILEDGW